MACHLKMETVVESKFGIVRPATGAYAQEAIEALKSGKVIAVPTDTLYGFACDAWYQSHFYDFPLVSFFLLCHFMNCFLYDFIYLVL